MNPVDPVRDNVIFVSDDNIAVYITPLKYKLGILETNPNVNEVEIQDWAKRAMSGDDLDYLLFPFSQGKLSTDWWDYIVEHKRQFLNKEIVFCVMNKMKHLYKDIAFDKDIRKQFNRSLAYKFFTFYDFCIQCLSTGDYNQKDIIEIYSTLEDEDLYKLMQNHLHVLESNFASSRLQEESQKDVINHIVNHVILSYYEWQGWITEK
jgi:hypothetical protein